MLVEEVQHHLIPTLILFLNLLLLKVTACRHPAVNLVWEPFYNVRNLDTLLPLLNIVFRLIAGRKHDVGNLDAGGVVASNHGGVARSGDLELCAFHGRQIDNLCGVSTCIKVESPCSYLSAPAEANDSPLLNAVLLAEFVDNLRNARQCLRRRSLRLEELTHLLLLLLGVWRHPGYVGWVALEEIRHENLVLLAVGVSQNISALQCLIKESEDVVDD